MAVLGLWLLLVLFGSISGQDRQLTYCSSTTCSGTLTVNNSAPILNTCVRTCDPCSSSCIDAIWTYNASTLTYLQTAFFTNSNCTRRITFLNPTNFACGSCVQPQLTQLSVRTVCPGTAVPVPSAEPPPPVPPPITPSFTPQETLEIGQCEPWAGQPAICRWVLNGTRGLSNVWVGPNGGVTQSQLAAQMYQNQVGLDFSVLSPVLAMPYNCSKNWLRLFCPTFFGSCSEQVVNATTTYSVNNRPDKTVCEETNEACLDFFTKNGQSLLDCNQQNPSFGSDAWPNQQYSLAEVTIETDPWPITAVIDPVYDCPAPLIWVHPRADALSGSPCALPCIPLSASFLPDLETYERGWTVYVVLGWLSWFGSFYILVTHIVFPDLWEFPHRLVTPIAFGVLCMYTPIFANTRYGPNYTNPLLCDDYLAVSWQNPTVQWGAWSIQFGAWIVANYWLTQSILLFTVVVLRASPNSLRPFEVAFHIWAWCMAMIFSFIPLGIDALGSELLVPFPFVSLHAAKWVGWFFWFSWLFLYLVQEFITSGSSIVVMIFRKFKSDGLTAWDQIRLALFAVLFFQTALAGLTFRLWEEANGFQSQVADWFQCLFTQNDTSTCAKPFVPVGLYWWSLVTFALIGIYVFLIFGLMNKRVILAWFLAIRNVINGESFFANPYPEEESERPSTTIGMKNVDYSQET